MSTDAGAPTLEIIRGVSPWRRTATRATGSIRPFASSLQERGGGGHELFAENVGELIVRTAGELLAVDEFVRLSDDVGLRIPSARDSVQSDFINRLRRLSTDSVLNGDVQWLSPEFDDTFGLAQHHGVPTRLLDFTMRPFVAAFFAAQNPAGERIAVWAVDRLSLMASRITVLTCRRYDNTFLHAQDGLFLYDPEAPYDFLCSGAWPSIESVLESERETERSIRKLTLPASESAPLLRLLWRERVSIAHLMPTYDNIVHSVPLYWKLLDDYLEARRSASRLYSRPRNRLRHAVIVLSDSGGSW